MNIQSALPRRGRLWSVVSATCAVFIVHCGPGAVDDGGSPLDGLPVVLVASPAVTIGSSPTPNDDFIAPWPVGRDASGSVYIYDNRTGELRRFSSAGQFQSIVAKRGGGPGELRLPTGFWVDSGTVTVWEGLTGRYAIISATQGLVEEGNYPFAARPRQLTSLIAVAPSGEFIVRDRSEKPVPFEGSRATEEISIVRITNDPVRWDTLHTYERPSPSLRFHGGGTVVADPGPALGIIALYDVHQPSIVRVERPVPDEGERATVVLERVTLNGGRSAQVRYSLPSVSLSGNVRDSLADVMSRIEREITGSSGEFQVSWPNSYPAVETAVISHGDGRLWLKLYWPGDHARTTWVVFDRSLTPIARVILPFDLRSPLADGNTLFGTVEHADGSALVHGVTISDAQLQIGRQN